MQRHGKTLESTSLPLGIKVSHLFSALELGKGTLALLGLLGPRGARRGQGHEGKW